jgi:hypothetical protein
MTTSPDGDREAIIIYTPPPPGASLAYIAAWQRRQRANQTGQCDCGATFDIEKQDGILHAYMHHEHDCPASDDALERLYQAGTN